MTQQGRATTLGPFDFQFTLDEVKAYRNALSFPAGEDVPITFFTRVLTEPAVLPELHKVLDDQIPIHIEQSFDVIDALRPGTYYTFALVIQTLEDSRMRLTGTFSRFPDETCVVMHSEFLLVQPALLK